MKLTVIIANVLSIAPSTLSNESSRKNTPNWDDTRHIDLMLAIEVAFDVQFNFEEITSMQNLSEMRALLIKRGAPKSAVMA